ncbi:MAG: hypothetical protein NXI04_03265 [Planctomycetaceae bacterium]|nr:hypothetical protein [Planctomycetaceae bacterium]
MNWRARILEYAESNACKPIVDVAGIGLEYEDGCDVFWILPREPGSTVPIASDDEVNPVDLTSIFERVNKYRSKAIHLIRYYCADKGYHLIESFDGDWGYSSKYVDASFDVGEALTAIVLEHGSFIEAFHAWCEAQWLKDPPNKKTIARWLKEPPPPNPPEPIDDDDDEETGIVGAAAWLSLCSGLKELSTLSDEELKARLTAGRQSTATELTDFFKQLGELLPNAKASVDLCRDDRLLLDFSDELDDYSLRINSAFEKRLKTEGADTVARQVADEYLRLDSLRARAVNAIWFTAANTGQKVERLNYCFFGGSEAYFIGSVTRDITFDAGRRLTMRLKNLASDDVFDKTFEEHPDFAAKCKTAFATASSKLDGALQFASLLPLEMPDPPPLVELTTSVIERTDKLATEAIEHLFRTPNVMYRYGEPNFIGKSDHWLDSSRWTELARKHIDDRQWTAVAATILLDHGDQHAESVARSLVASSTEPHHESSDDLIELIWKYRHEFPEIARAWFGPNAYRSCYYDRLVKLGDPVSIRQVEAENRSLQEVEEDELTPDQLRQMPTDFTDQIRQQLKEWARETHQFSPIDQRKIQLAVDMGWLDVFTDLETNPWLPAIWLRSNERGDQFDEPGLLMSTEAVLAWSRVRPTEFLARLVATAFDLDLVSLAVEASERSALKNSSERDTLGICQSVYQQWNASLQASLGIAWLRFRAIDDGFET